MSDEIKWIKTNKQMPPKDREFLGLWDSDYIKITDFTIEHPRKGTGYYRSGHIDEYNAALTYWCELPEKPIVKDDE